MRLALFALTAALFVCATTVGQDAGKKEFKPGIGGGSEKDTEEKQITEVAGKNLDQWIKEIGSIDPSRREQARRMVLVFGAKRAQRAVPILLKELGKHTNKRPIDVSVRVSGCTALGVILSSIKNPDQKDVYEAVKILRDFCYDDQVIVRT